MTVHALSCALSSCQSSKELQRLFVNDSVELNDAQSLVGASVKTGDKIRLQIEATDALAGKRRGAVL